MRSYVWVYVASDVGVDVWVYVTSDVGVDVWVYEPSDVGVDVWVYGPSSVSSDVGREVTIAGLLDGQAGSSGCRCFLEAMGRGFTETGNGQVRWAAVIVPL